MAITFESIENGALNEQFKMGLAEIGRDIMNPNKDPEAARSMTITITFKPNKSGAINGHGDVKTKLAGFQKCETIFLIGQDAKTGRIEMSEYGNREQVTRIEPPAAAYTEVQKPVPPKQAFDPDTGEIYEQQEHRGPIDLRAAANQ